MPTPIAEQDRIGARVPHDVYQTLCRAAELSGATVNQFLVQAALKEAQSVMLVDALARAQRIYAGAGGIGLFVDAPDTKAAGYYLNFGFDASPDDPLLLFLSAKIAK